MKTLLFSVKVSQRLGKLTQSYRKFGLFAVVLLGLTQAQAATYLVDELHDGVKYYWDFQNNTNPVTGWVQGEAQIGEAWQNDFLRNTDGYASIGSGVSPYHTLSSCTMMGGFTLSFDVRELTWEGLNKCLVSFDVTTTAGKKDVLSVQPMSPTASSGRLNTYLGTAMKLNADNLTPILRKPEWSTLTFVMLDKRLSIYLNGELFASSRYRDVEIVSFDGIQFGQAFGGTGDKTGAIISADIDNIVIWDKALTAEDVELLTTAPIPEPATITMSLVSLLFFVCRRRRVL